MKKNGWIAATIVAIAVAYGWFWRGWPTSEDSSARAQGEESPLGSFGSEREAGTEATESGAPESAVPLSAPPKTAPSSAAFPRLDWLEDPELDALRMDVYRAELRARLAKAQAEVRQADVATRREAERKVEEAKAKAPPPKPRPKLKLVAVDERGAVVEVNGRVHSFQRVGERIGDVTLKEVGPSRAVIEIDGDSFELRF
ncbi:MAG: hypothetical protein HYY13_13490 [Nitrospirae bacterium]|nr:hypothetical protein [Nitrospirota bacterium]